ncbi:hypothetical protein DERF_011539 [Dermatophagoides farinae]|uniref:Uncharacterized protein n=1 Tax=Dermatophagoides farinae TaxID=6954 RepID=A0A922HSD9_DERFA|nr:hypothetical protein DERF_011539 [Dermatophagoides farinae]
MDGYSISHIYNCTLDIDDDVIQPVLPDQDPLSIIERRQQFDCSGKLCSSWLYNTVGNITIDCIQCLFRFDNKRGFKKR